MSLTMRMCRVCGCTDDDCSGCIARTGEPCCWVEPNLCSACVVTVPKPLISAYREVSRLARELASQVAKASERMECFCEVMGPESVLRCARCDTVVARFRSMAIDQSRDVEPEHCPGCLKRAEQKADELRGALRELDAELEV